VDAEAEQRSRAEKSRCAREIEAQRAPTLGEEGESDSDENLLARHDVDEKPSPTARVASVEVEGRIGEHDRGDTEREREDASRVTQTARSEKGRGERERHERFCVRHVDDVKAQSPERRDDGGLPCQSVGQHRGDVIAMLVQAPDPTSESVGKTTRGSVGEGIISGLRRSEE
jgi:hypothetical protein